jgi:hypothetical protein
MMKKYLFGKNQRLNKKNLKNIKNKLNFEKPENIANFFFLQIYRKASH